MVMSFISNGAKLSTVFFSQFFFVIHVVSFFPAGLFFLLFFFVKSVICCKAIFCTNLIEDCVVDCNLY